MITDPNSINYYLEKAYDICKSGRPGPVFIDIPADMQNAKIDEKKILKFKYKSPKKKYSIDKKISKIIKKLKQSKRPLIHIGHGVKLSNAKELARNFFNKFQIPFVVT